MSFAPNFGWGGSALDAVYGSSDAPNANAPELVRYDGLASVWLPGAAGNYCSTPDSAALDLSGDVDIAVLIAPAEWNPATPQGILAKAAVGFVSYLLELGPDGAALTTSADGTTLVSASSGPLSFAPDTGPGWLRATRDLDDGSGSNITSFYWASAAAQEPSSWLALGQVITSGATSLLSTTEPLEIGSAGGGAGLLSGHVHRAILRDGINGAVVLDADFTAALVDGSETSIVESSPNAATVSILRASSGRRSAAVVGALWAIGPDDWLEVADSPLLDPGAGSQTAVVVARTWSTQATGAVLAAKVAGAADIDPGWRLAAGASPLETTATISDGNAIAVAAAPARTDGARAASVAIRDRAAGQLSALLDSSPGLAAADATASVAAAAPLRIGSLSTASADQLSAEVFAAAVWRRALSPAELSSVLSYWGL